MTGPSSLESSAAGLRRCADRLGSAFDGLLAESRAAWSCPAAVGFETELGARIVALADVATGLRAVAARLDAEAALLAGAEAAAVAHAGSMSTGRRR